MTYIKSIWSLMLVMLMLISCDSDFESVNSNPNEPEVVSPGVLLTGATRSSMNSMVKESFLLANNIAQITAKTLRSEVDRYEWNAFTTLWLNQYDALADFADAENIASNKGDTATEAAAIIMQSWVYSSLTMAYGDIPYSEAIAGTESDNFTPAYDQQQAILDGDGGLLERLKQAEVLLDEAVSNNIEVEGDIIYNGNPSKWKKLANVLQLRILLHLSNKRDVSGDMQTILAEGNLFESNNDNATLNYLGSFPNNFPIFPFKQGDFDAVVMAKPAVNMLENYSDPRLGVYARPDNITEINTFVSAQATYSGADNGNAIGSCDKGGSRLGARYYDYPSHPSGEKQANGILTTYAEQELILAEAAFKGLIPNNTETHYKNGIVASMEYYNVSLETFGWTGVNDFYDNSGVAFDNTLNKIWEQKWIATFFHGMEPFFDVRRMVYEANNGDDFAVDAVQFLTVPCENLNSDQMPVRFLYPGNEQSLNSENYQEAVSRLGGNNQNAKMYLME
ncbi:SusD/RagB family nutrient-binding outer membrane lipoprotein [Psychroflexus sp. CAK1W]|uniref:SusD/RagB family nutrient-binding outer membrane lipoprotein n=1 Tax=Psychroflexus curvus TaxID=2873595 RepID=UPI001CCA7E54|nr:SusD/RagB family nutrient-binding outer membrane lipoprotein [Psychroflexus curvus]MBZ9628550.1 SusD/RagB family nutrient-binding outer membrane lipoprotein [Psychroflexus curvus]